jgi:hypothetical protein
VQGVGGVHGGVPVDAAVEHGVLGVVAGDAADDRRGEGSQGVVAAGEEPLPGRLAGAAGGAGVHAVMQSTKAVRLSTCGAA